MTEVDIAKLADLARLDVSEEEMQELEREIPKILAFVEQVAQVSDADTKHVGTLYNVMREDENPHAGGAYTDEMLAAAPKTRDNSIVVRKIISLD